jgi:hypothetical protein
MTRFVLATAALLVAVRGAAAQDRLEIQGTDAETAAKVAEIAASANTRGLPAGAVINEARFAALYKVPGDRIVMAARGVADRLAIAREALQPDPSARDIEAGAEALKYGISADVLRDIRKNCKGPVAVPIGLLIQLFAEPNKMQVKRASAIVLDLVKRGADTRMIAELGNAVNSDVALGMSPDKSLAFHLNALQPLLGPGVGAAETARDALTAGSATGPPRKRPP